MDRPVVRALLPVAVLFTAVFLLPAVAVLGPPPAAVLLFFVLHTTASAYAHGNVRLPHRLERALRALLVTPTMHVVHHSAEAPETDRNFGEIFSLWDRLFGTYLAAPRAGIQTMPIGLETFRSARDLWLDRTLTIPFRSGAVDDARA